MDPKALSNLDPKLRETYERVMGTPSPTATPLVPTVNPTLSPIPTMGDGGALTPAPVTTTATVTTPDGTVAQATPPVQPVNPWQNQANSSPNPFTPTGQALPSPATVAGQDKGTSPMLRVLYIIGAVVFFALYSIFWIKVFKLPFLF